uniref:Double zinc ribbon and ankyrin repeat domains 1 n=1 Tax=Mastacembelus armatus TaxID=205130 RepID=A0A3Q3N3G7_9TELE
MTAGAVSAPLIIPIILQTHRTKNHIDTNTPVSIQSDTPGVLIFYTLDGSKPAAVQRGSSGSSRKYSEPILLPVADQTTLTHSSNHQAVLGYCTEKHLVTYFVVFLACQSPDVLKQLSSTQMSRIQRETDFLRCVQCLSFRPSDPFARFCAHCGAVVPPLPEQRLPPAEGGQTLCCVFCKTVVPVNTHTCLTCEAPIPQQLQPQATLALQSHVVCVCCGSGNPGHISSCLTCESHLRPAASVGHSAPSVPSAHSRMLSCSRCKRINRSDARYCDWCGSKVHTTGNTSSSVICRRCGASGHPYAFYCAACGVYLEAPDVLYLCEQASASTSHGATWQVTPSSGPASKPKPAPPTVDQCTQTVGLYYPSATELHKKEQQRVLQLSKQQAGRDRQPLLTAISPGKGYWRKQLDHVCAHLRSYAQNNTPFRTLLGEPRLGRMVSAVIQEDQYEVSMTISFVSAGREEKQVIELEFYCRLTSCCWFSWFQGKDAQLLKELGPGHGQVSAIQQLLDQGADPSCCSSNGLHALAVAVVSGHHDVLPVLVQRGADIDQQSGQMKNTALHEAAALGPDGLRCAQVLLSCKASVRRRNAAGQTAYDVAVNSGCNDMVSLLAAQTGLHLLGKLGKPKLNLDVF